MTTVEVLGYISFGGEFVCVFVCGGGLTSGQLFKGYFQTVEGEYYNRWSMYKGGYCASKYLTETSLVLPHVNRRCGNYGLFEWRPECLLMSQGPHSNFIFNFPVFSVDFLSNRKSFLCQFQ